PQTRIGLIVPRDRIPGLIAALQKQFALDDRSVADQATVKADSIRIFNRTFAVTSALNAFTLGVAGIALLTSLLTLANSRLPEPGALSEIRITPPRAALGDRHHPAAPCCDRADQDAVGRAVHVAARRAARAVGGVVPDRDRERQ